MRFSLQSSKPSRTASEASLRETPTQITPVPLSQLCRPTLFFTLLFAGAAVLAQGQDFTSIVVFGDSLSDTGNFAHLTGAKYRERIPGPVADYADGRFTDGSATLPAAQKYFGVWIEQLAAGLPSKPRVKDSLDGGTNYAYGDATTGKGLGTVTFGPSNEFSVVVENIGQQITDYLGTHPRINNKTLFVVWGGANDLLAATSSGDVINAAIQQTLNIQRLIDAGATHFIVPNLPPLGLVPRLNGSTTTSVTATEASVLYNSFLATGLAVLRDFNPGRHLVLAELDVFTLFSRIVVAPATYSLVNVTASSQGLVTVDPDTYLFWDDIHPTTRGHNLVAQAAALLISQQAQTVKGEANLGR